MISEDSTFEESCPFSSKAISFCLSSSLYLLLISLTAFAGSIQNTYAKFAIPAFTPVILNLSMIVAAIFLSQYFPDGVTALAVGVLIAGVLQLLFQFPFLETKKSYNENEISRLLEFNYKEFTLYNTKDIVHKLSHQHLHSKFWIIYLDDLDNSDSNDLKNFFFFIFIEKIFLSFQ